MILDGSNSNADGFVRVCVYFLLCCTAITPRVDAQEAKQDVFSDEKGNPVLGSRPFTPEMKEAFERSIGFDYKQLQNRLIDYRKQRELFVRDSGVKDKISRDEPVALPRDFEEPSARLKKLKASWELSESAASLLERVIRTKSKDELNQVGAKIRDSDYNEVKLSKLMVEQKALKADYDALEAEQVKQ